MNPARCRRNQQVLAYLDLVNPIASHYSRTSGQDRDDLTQVGRLGLLKAANHFDPDQSDTFPGFAKAHIRGAILHYLRDSIGLVRLPRSLQEEAQRLIKTMATCGTTSRPRLTAEETLLISTYRNQGRWGEYVDHSHTAFEPQTETGWRYLTEDEQRQALKACWATLTTQERDCLQAVVLHGCSLRSAAKKMGTSAMTVQRRVKRGLQTLASQCRKRGMKLEAS